ncbi:MAG: hypothetical protein HOV80_09095, partial [Polyangiaceae bacterium]|nr:hypothetical protein [Polyangiaceae bacterium]
MPFEGVLLLAELFSLASRLVKSINAPAEEREHFDEQMRGLGLEPKHGVARRDDDGIRVIASHTRRDRNPLSVVTATLEPPLDLGLIVESRSLNPRGWSIAIGDRAFDDPGSSYRVSADEARRVQKLLGPKIRQAILSTPSGYNVKITDSFVRFEEPGRASIIFFEGAMRSAADLVRRLQKNAERTPAAKALTEHARTYRALAEARGLELCKTPLGIVGQVAGCDVGIASVRRGRGSFGAQAIARLTLDCSDEDFAHRKQDASLRRRLEEVSKL